jgi:glycosyltransferase involved in cell wall biosynthesis
MPLEILHVTPYYEDAWGYGGIPRVASTLCRSLARRGHRITVCTTDACDSRGRLRGASSPAPGVDVQVFPNLSDRLAYHRQLFLPVGLRGFLRHLPRRVDVAHIHGCHHLLGVAAAAEMQRRGVPYLLEPNGTAGLIERRRWAKWVFDVTVGRRVLPAATGVIAVTDAERRRLCALGVPPARLRLVPNAVDPDEFAPLPERGGFRGRFAPGARQLILYLGRLSPRKDVDLLVRALSTLDESVALVIAGNDMGSGATLRALVRRLGLEPRVRFAGALVGRERLAAYVDADVVAYPGHDEIFGLVPIEALLCGAPVVVADDSGCAEVIAEVGGGRIATSGDVLALAAALRDVLTHASSWRESASAAGDRVRQRFAGDVVAVTLERVYLELLGRQAIAS